MLGEYKVSRCSRKCHALDRPLREGEWYYSVVMESGDEYERRDYSAEGWKGPPEGAVGWWKSRMPTADDKKMVLAPPEVLVDLLRQMEKFPERAKSRYLLALMLMRRKIVRPVYVVDANATNAGDTNAVVEGGADQSKLQVEVVADGGKIEVPVCEITRSESDRLKDQLLELLYCEVEEGEPGDGDPGERD